MTVQLWAFARDKMKQADKAEVFAYAKGRPGSLVMGYDSRQRRFFANISGTEAYDSLSPMAAFRKAVKATERVEVVSLLTGPAA